MESGDALLLDALTSPSPLTFHRALAALSRLSGWDEDRRLSFILAVIERIEVSETLPGRQKSLRLSRVIESVSLDHNLLTKIALAGC